MNHISNVRQIMIDQLKALRSASTTDLQNELDRSRGVSELCKTVIDTAKCEIDYLKVTGQDRSDFLEPADMPAGITSITRHRIAG